ncbi:NACHT domain-containing protein [Blastococcus fimeti]|nr:NACHT domain-containing protein [Blastococcus fimeti]
MGFQALGRMQQRVQSTRADCDDTTLFLELLYLGELTLKLLVAGMVAAVNDDRDRHRYRLEHGLVRASGVGDWAGALDDLLTGPAAATLAPSARQESAELTKNFDLSSDSAWQVDSIAGILEACRILDPNYAGDARRVSARAWARHFAWLRNKTRGHGATTATNCGLMAIPLERSILAIIDGFSLFQRDWAYLHRNLSGKYRVIPITDSAESLEHLKRSNEASLADGVHVVFDSPRPVRLVVSDVELSDFFLCNGGYTESSYEALSYVTDQRKQVDASEFRLPPTPLPESETEGQGTLEPQGGLFGNLPPRRADYVRRPQLEEELTKVLLNDRHAVVTLVGRGGIGKTSLALQVLHDLAGGALADRFFAVLWFSARDVDLTERGPKLVRPRVVSIPDIADQFVDLLRPAAAQEKGFRKVDYVIEHLGTKSGDPMLFVFDNFETVLDPQQMYEWLDTYVRPPNKILITTRLRDFKGDYPVEVSGMRRGEFDELVDQTARQLGIGNMVTPTLRTDLFDESDGHPYVAKLLLGEIANRGKTGSLATLVANRDDVLQALFERTYNQLTPLGQRLFLTLCGWRSAVPRLAVEAALLRVAEEPLDTGRAVDHLIRSSMVEATRTPEGDEFLTVPLAAALFGRKKLHVSALSSAIDADLAFLRLFGAAREADVRKGLLPRLRRLVRAIAQKAQGDPEALTSYRAVLEHIARQHPPAWLLLADLYEEQQDDAWLAEAAEAVRHYLEERPQDIAAWTRLSLLCRRCRDYQAEAQALVTRSTQPEISYDLTSEAAYRLNQLYTDNHLQAMPEDERMILCSTLLDVLDSAPKGELTATDLSRMAWLAVRTKDDERAKRYVLAGHERDPDNIHIKRLGWVVNDK